jgi:hypothetical protein
VLAETHDATCADCRFCLDRGLLDMNVVIAVKIHGQHQNAAHQALTRCEAA